MKTGKHKFTAPSVCWGSPYYCDGWRGKRGERWPLPPHHLSMNSEQLDRRWGNYAVIITCACAQAYYINAVPYTPDGVPNISSPVPPSLLHTSLLYYLLSSLHQQGNSSLPGKLASSGSWSVTVCVCERLFALYACSHAYTGPLCMLTINKACLALGPLHH